MSTKKERLFFEKLIAVIPTNWCDPLLTGPTAKLGNPPWGCPDVEALLREIRERQLTRVEEHIRRIRKAARSLQKGEEK